MILELPLDAQEKNYTVSTVLEGSTYTFAVRWNGRAESWFFDLYDVNGEIIVAGIRIVLGIILGRRCTDTRFPPGALKAEDLSNTGVEAGRDELGGRVRVYYYTADEFA